MNKITKQLLSIPMIVGVLLSGFQACSKLEDTVLDAKTSSVDLSTSLPTIDQTKAADFLSGAYSKLYAFSDQANIYALLEHTSDEMIGPTRGTDWDDFGIWKKLNKHQWDPTHGHIETVWNQLNQGLYTAVQSVVANASSPAGLAESKFLRAFFMYYLVDFYGQVPYKDPTKVEKYPTVMTRTQAVDYIIKDLSEAIPNLADFATTPGKASKQAAQFLLAKVYLNKFAWLGAAATADDMNKVIANCDAIINSTKFTLETDYYKNFSPANNESKEIIFSIVNEVGRAPASCWNRWKMTTHYNQATNGWNGFTTLSNFYDKFADGDQRKGVSNYPGLTSGSGLTAGFAVGQQYNKNGDKLKDRSGNDLAFTKDIDLDLANEVNGIRVLKYFPTDNFDANEKPGNDNDYVFFRYADVLLMYAEAVLRGGTATSTGAALAVVNQVRTARSATALASITLDVLLDERGRELYWEGWRRNDLVRFDKFNAPTQVRPTSSDATRKLFCIPSVALTSNPNLTQNPGY